MIATKFFFHYFTCSYISIFTLYVSQTPTYSTLMYQLQLNNFYFKQVLEIVHGIPTRVL